MTTVPDDVRAKAMELRGSLCIDEVCVDRGCGCLDLLIEALMQERERCAQIAEAMPCQIHISPDHTRSMRGQDVADAIRTPDPA